MLHIQKSTSTNKMNFIFNFIALAYVYCGSFFINFSSVLFYMILCTRLCLATKHPYTPVPIVPPTFTSSQNALITLG